MIVNDVWGDAALNPLKVFTDMLEFESSDLTHWKDDCFHPREPAFIDTESGAEAEHTIVTEKKKGSKKQQRSNAQKDLDFILKDVHGSDSEMQQKLDAIVAEVEAFAPCGMSGNTEGK